MISGAALLFLCSALTAAASPKPDPAAIEFFEKQARPVLAAYCVSCHGASQQFSSLRVDSREALLHGGNRVGSLTAGHVAQPVEAVLS